MPQKFTFTCCVQRIFFPNDVANGKHNDLVLVAGNKLVVFVVSQLKYEAAHSSSALVSKRQKLARFPSVEGYLPANANEFPFLNNPFFLWQGNMQQKKDPSNAHACTTRKAHEGETG